MRDAQRQAASARLARPAWGFGLGLAFYAALVALWAGGAYLVQPKGADPQGADPKSALAPEVSRPTPAARGGHTPHRSCASAPAGARGSRPLTARRHPAAV